MIRLPRLKGVIARGKASPKQIANRDWFRRQQQAIIDRAGGGGESLCDVYLFDGATTDSLQLGAPFTGNLKVMIAGLGTVGLHPDILAGIQGTFTASVDPVNDPIWNQFEISATAIAYIVDNTFSGRVAYAKDDVWFDVDMGAAEIIPFTQGSKKLSATHEGYMIGGITFANTQHLKIEAESAFKRVRIRYIHPEAGGGVIKFDVAPTDVYDTSTDNNRYKPVIGGVVNDAAWVGGKFLGLSDGVIAGAVGAIRGVTVSDWVDVDSIPVVDSASGRPLLLLKLHINSGGVSVVSSGASGLWRASSASPTFRVMDGKTETGDTTGNPALSPTGVYSGGMLLYGVEFDYAVECNSVMNVGDSITAGGGGQLATFDTWGQRATASISTTAVPFESYNDGLSGHDSDDFIGNFYNEVANGIRPKFVTLPAFTPNDGSPSQAGCEAMIEKVKGVAIKCQEIGSNLIVWTGLPNDVYSAALDGFRQGCNDWARDPQNQADFKFTMLDWDVLVGTNAVPNRFKPGWSDDMTHPTDVAIQAMADDLASALQGLV